MKKLQIYRKYSWRLLLCISCIVYCLYLLPTYASPSFPTPTKNLFVHDYTRTLSAQDSSYITQIGESLWQQTGVQSIVVIVPSTTPYPISDYANQLFRTWGIGNKEVDNGLLMLVALEDKTWRIEIGRGLEGMMPDLLSSEIMTTHAVPAFQKDAYSEGITSAYSAMNQVIADHFGITLSGVPATTTQPSQHNSFPSLWLVLLLAIDIIFNRGRFIGTLFRLMLLRNIYGGPGSSNRGNGGGNFGGGSSNGGGSSGSW